MAAMMSQPLRAKKYSVAAVPSTLPAMAMAAKPQTPFPKVSNAGMTAIRFKVAPTDIRGV